MTNLISLQHPRVLVSAARLGLGGIRTHLVLLCQLLRRQGVEVSVYATGSDWDEPTLAEVKATGVRFFLPPACLRSYRNLSAIYCRLTWPFRIPRKANSLYCIGPGRSHLLMHRLLPMGTTSINHEIVEPPCSDSLAGRCAVNLDVTVANSRRVAALMQKFWPEKPIRMIVAVPPGGPAQRGAAADPHRFRRAFPRNSRLTV